MSDLNWDFHCHSTASDGLLPAAEVARRAAGNGVQLLALTDHDDLAGLPAARAAAEEMGMGLVNGVEVSIEWEGLSIHVVGLGFDAANPVLNEGLAGIRSGPATPMTKSDWKALHAEVQGLSKKKRA